MKVLSLLWAIAAVHLSNHPNSVDAFVPPASQSGSGRAIDNSEGVRPATYLNQQQTPSDPKGSNTVDDSEDEKKAGVPPPSLDPPSVQDLQDLKEEIAAASTPAGGSDVGDNVGGKNEASDPSAGVDKEFGSEDVLKSVDDVAAQAAEALEQAAEALNEVNAVQKEGDDSTTDIADGASVDIDVADGSSEPDEINPPKVPIMQEQKTQEPPKPKLSKEEQERLAALEEDALAVAAGGASIGLIGGIALDIAQAVDINPAVPPTILGAILGAVGYGVAKEESSLGETIRSTLGAISKSIFGSVKEAAADTAQKTVDTITVDIPNQIKTSVQESVDKTKEEISAIPTKVKDAAVDATESLKEAAVDATENAIDEIKATPSRIVDQTKKTVIETVENVEDTVEKAVEDAVEDITTKVDDLVSLPGRKLDEIQTKIDTIIADSPLKGDVDVKESKAPVAPKVESSRVEEFEPKAPPPPKTEPIQQKEETKTPESVVQKAKPGATISLGFFGFGQEPGDKSAKKPVKPSELPADVPVLSRWKQNSDGTITGLISESSSFGDGESITTTPIEEKAVGGTVVKTISGSRYFLQKETTGLSLGSIFGGGSATVASAEEKERDEVRKAAEKATVERIKEVRRMEAEERKAAAYEAAEDKKRRLEEKRSEMQRKRQEYEDRIAAQAQAKRVDAAEEKLTKAKPGATISLGFINFGNKADSDEKEEPKVMSSAPRGVPVISNWKENTDGSISGTLKSASNIFKKGEEITTSPITTKAIGGAVIETRSGSKYYLEPSRSTTVSLKKTNKVLDEINSIRKEINEARASSVKPVPKALPVKKPKIEKKINPIMEAKKQAYEERLAAQADAKRKAAAAQAMEKAESGATVSLGFFGFGQRNLGDTVNVVTAPPKGIPVLSSWKQNTDGSISGLVSGSSTYDDDEAITTSPIVGDAIGGAVVKTKTGSRYFLKPETSSAEDRYLGFLGFGGKAEKVQKQADIRENMLSQKEKAKKDKAAEFAAVARQREIAKAKKDAERAKKKAVKEALEAKRQEKEAEAKQRKLAAANAKQERARKLQEAESDKKRILEEKKAEAKKLLDQKRALYEEQMAQRAREKKEASEANIAKASKGSTISLGFLSGFTGGTRTSSQGVPTISQWKQNRDGSITGLISGSKDYTDGESITTSRITGKAKGGTTVSTTSGSRYLLAALQDEPAKKVTVPRDSAAQDRIAAAAQLKEQQLQERRLLEEKRKQEKENRRLARIAEFEAKKKQMQEKKEAMQAAADAKKREIEAKKAAAKEALEEKRRLYEEKAAEAARKKRETAQQQVVQAQPGATISLGLFGFGGQKESEANAATSKSAPRGVPILNKWRQNRDGSITGFISGSNAFSEGESITTSPITGSAKDGAVVKTVSGSKYFLSPISSKETEVDAKAKAQEEKQRLVDERKREVEERKAAARVAAEAKKRDLEAKRAAAAELKQRQLEEKRAAVAARQKEAEERRAALAAAADAEKKRAMSRRSALGKQKAAEAKLGNAKAGATISLGSFFGGGKEDEAEPTPRRALQTKPKGPVGVPSISKWKENRDGSITGFISGSSSYKDGESITTSPLSGKAVGGKVAVTRSGSRYFLEPQVSPAETKRGLFGRKVQPKSPNLSRKSRKEEKVVEKASPGATISLGFLGQKKATEPKPIFQEVQMQKRVKKTAQPPRGVPILSKWKRNRDGSITGFVSGSNAFRDGESITTSPIETEVADGKVVTTGSGSRYYLQPK